MERDKGDAPGTLHPKRPGDAKPTGKTELPIPTGANGAGQSPSNMFNPSILAKNIFADPSYPAFRSKILTNTGLDLDLYKSNQLQRRLNSIIHRHGATDLEAYGRMLEENPQLLHKFLDFFTINVSEFFRNPDKFTFLQETVIPGLLREAPVLKVWSAGCSIGAEVYSLAMILSELTPGRRHQIIATDIDRRILERAAGGLYRSDELKNVSPQRLTRFFSQEPEGFRLKPELLRSVTFRYHNLLSDPFERGFHLITCRNVVIYFTAQAKESLYERFAHSLVPGGILFVGGTETIFQHRAIGLENLASFFYRRLPAQSGKNP